MSLLLEVTPANITSRPGFSFTRATTATYVDASGVVQTAAAGELRNAHYIDGVRTVLTEPASTNEVLDTDMNPGTSTDWTTGSGPTVTAGQSDPAGGTDAILVEDTNASGAQFMRSGAGGDYVINATEATVSIHLKAGTAGRTEVNFRDITAAANRHIVEYDWSSGVLSTSSGSGTLFDVEALTDGWLRIAFSADGLTSGNDHRLFVYPAGSSGAAADVGTVSMFGPQVENLAVPTSYIPTSGSAVTRNADEPQLTGNDPQEGTLYLDAVSLGLPTGAKLAQFGNAAPLLALMEDSGGVIGRHNDNTNTDDTAALSAAPDYGDRVEHALQLSSSGTPTLVQSINGGATESATDATPNASLQGAYGDGNVYIGWDGTGNHAPLALRRMVHVTGVQSMDAMRSGSYTFAREWRLRIHDEGTTTPADGTVAYTFDSEVAQPPEVGGQTVRILDGRSESQPWQVRLVDKTEAVTDVLGDANDRAQLAYRIADIGKRDDGGTWETLATGRISDIKLDRFAAYVVSISDERVIERNSTLFKGAGGTTQIWWPGFVNGSYGPFTTPPFASFVNNNPGRVIWRKGAHSGNSTVLLSSISFEDEVGASTLLRVIEDDVTADAADYVDPTTATEGSYRNLRLRLDSEGSDREVIAFNEAAAGGTAAKTGRGGLLTGLTLLHVYDPSDNLPADDTGYLYMPGADPSDEVPLHIEAKPGQLLQDIYDGNYSDASIRYDSTAMTALQNRLQADGVGTRRWRITGTVNMARWLEDNIYKPLGVVPLIGSDGSIVPVKVYPTESEVADIGALHEFTEGDCRILDWHYAPNEAVSVVRVTYPQESVGDRDKGPPNRDSLDSLTETEQPHEETHDTSGDADRVIELELTGWHDREKVERFMGYRAREVFEMFGDGPLYCTLWGGHAADVVDAGDYVVVNHSALPSFTGDRGGSRIMFVMSRTSLAVGYRFDLIEVGPSLQPLSAPSISVAQNGNGADVTVSSLATGAKWELRLHDGDSAGAPSDTDAGWRSIAVIPNGTSVYTVPKIKLGVKVWFQARARKEGRVPSDWSTAQSLTITALTAPSSLTLDETGGVYIRASFTVGETDYPTEVHLDGTLQLTLTAGSTSLTIRGLQTSTTYNSPGLQVRHIDPQTGAVSSFDTATFTTAGTAETAPAYNAARLLVGESG